MKKKLYEMPMVKKVHLEIKNSVLSVCHSSMVGDSNEIPGGCRCTIGMCSYADYGSKICTP